MKKITLTSLSIMSAISLGTPAVAASPGWGGFYGGLSVGYEDALVHNDGYTLNYFGITGTPNHPKTAIGGGFFGYNVELPGRSLMIGSEATFDIGGNGDSSPVNGSGFAAHAHVANHATVKGRVGYTGKAGFMPWFEAGVAGGQTNFHLSSTGIPLTGNRGTTTAVGVTAGIGVDYAFSGPLFMRVGYSYTHLGQEMFFRDQPGESFDLNDFKVGVGYRF